MNLTNHLRRGLVVGVAAASVVGGAADITRADSAAATTARTLSAATTTPAAHTPTPDGALAAVTAPSAPRSPTATSRNTVVRLAWLRPSSNGGAAVNKYRVQRATSTSGPWQTIAKPTVRRYRAVGLTNGKKYFFRVAAHNPAGWGVYSKVVSAVPRTVPTAPRSPTATPGNTTVKLAWAAPSSTGGAAVNKYAVQRSTTDTSGWTAVAQPTTRSYTGGGLTNGKNYCFRVRAHNAAGWGPWTTIVSATPRTVPSAPLGLFADTFKVGVVTLFWWPPASNGGAAIDDYTIWYSDDKANWFLASTTADTHLTLGKPSITKQYRVRAHNEAGYGAASDVTVNIP
jgi:hypothetical protein